MPNKGICDIPFVTFIGDVRNHVVYVLSEQEKRGGFQNTINNRELHTTRCELAMCACGNVVEDSSEDTNESNALLDVPVMTPGVQMV